MARFHGRGGKSLFEILVFSERAVFYEHFDTRTKLLAQHLQKLWLVKEELPKSVVLRKSSSKIVAIPCRRGGVTKQVEFK